MKATFGAGCFWGVQASFDKLSGVTKSTVGYEGGRTKDPNYEQVCTGTTGHTEVLELEFDSKTITYENLLDHFWSCHDPTQVNGQGPDHGHQYRSVIFFHSKEQQEQAEQSKNNHQKSLSNPIATAIEPAAAFYPAEEYHQKYIAKKQ